MMTIPLIVAMQAVLADLSAPSTCVPHADHGSIDPWPQLLTLTSASVK
jgi:hypothetical protein